MQKMSSLQNMLIRSIQKLEHLRKIIVMPSILYGLIF